VIEQPRAVTLPVLDRARRNPIMRPAYRQIFSAKAWSLPKAAAGRSESAMTAADSGAAWVFDLTRTGAPALMVLIGAVAVSCGANLGWLAWGSMQALGIVAPPALEAMQREQATAISQLDQNVNGLSAALAGLSARVSSVDAHEAETTRRIGEADAEIRVLRADLGEVRQAQSAAEDAWREPIADLKAAASRTQADIGRLRASIDEVSRARQPDLGAIAAKVDRIEHAMMERNLLSGMRGSIREHAEGKQPAADLASAADGHIITLPPAQ
jgi:hypothetical protein